MCDDYCTTLKKKNLKIRVASLQCFGQDGGLEFFIFHQFLDNTKNKATANSIILGAIIRKKTILVGLNNPPHP